MKSNIIQVNNSQQGVQQAFEETRRAAEIAGLSEKEAMHLRLLAEETMSMLRSVAGEVNASFWVAWEGKQFEIHLSALQKLGNIQRDQLIQSSTSGTNEAAKTFLGKLRDLFEQALALHTDITHFYSEEGVSEAVDISDEIIAAKRWDTYERSILRTLADHVSISIRGGEVDMVISKSFA